MYSRTTYLICPHLTFVKSSGYLRLVKHLYYGWLDLGGGVGWGVCLFRQEQIIPSFSTFCLKVFHSKEISVLISIHK